MLCGCLLGAGAGGRGSMSHECYHMLGLEGILQQWQTRYMSHGLVLDKAEAMTGQYERLSEVGQTYHYFPISVLFNFAQ